jgi:hypothetical protein
MLHGARMHRAALAIAVAAAVPAACFSGSPAAPPDTGVDLTPHDDAGGPAPLPFEPASPSSYVGKVKNLLVGQAATEDEVAAVTSEPNALRRLIDAWMQEPQYAAKMTAFFANAFQQTEVATTDFVDQSQIRTLNQIAGTEGPRLLESLRESFARTALALVNEGRPFRETMTTTRFMMNTPLLAYYAYVDGRDVDDEGVVKDHHVYPNGRITFEAAGGPIPLADSLDPASPSFMTFYEPALATGAAPCNVDPVVVGLGNPNIGASNDLFAYLFGGVILYRVPGMQCNVRVSGAKLLDGAYDQWRMVTIRPPAPGETPTRFYDVARLASATELVLRRPRVGFYTTPAFFAGWGTNASNQARVTLNQSLIVGLGRAIDGTDPTEAPSLAALDAEHAPVASTCYGCHRTLDPMRQFFVQTYDYNFGPQTDGRLASIAPMFAVDGVSVAATGIADLGARMAEHPRFAMAWTKKLCAYATSAECAEADPELQRIAQVFAASGFAWPALVRELFASPIVTYATETATVLAVGETFPVARREHLCAALAERLGIPDVCGLRAGTKLNAATKAIATIAASFPSDQYSRGAVAPVFANDPGLFFRAGIENVCASLAPRVVDAPKGGPFASTDIDGSIAKMVHGLMGLTRDRGAEVESVLHEHYAAAVEGGASPSVALQSTFVLACLSPATVGIGQ